MLDEYKIEDKKIFIVASSGVGLAKNTDDLVKKIFDLTQKELVVISSQLESKLMFKGCIPPKYYKDALLVDIGGGNTKGGYVDLFNDEDFVFFPLNLNLGTITLTEKINKIIQSDQISVFRNESIEFRPELKKEVNEMFKKRPLSFHKKNIYTSGGAVWAFYTLFFEGEAPENFNQYSVNNVLAYNEILQYNFEKLVELGKTNAEVARVLKTYSQKHLISANNILITSLQSIENVEDKKIYFAKQGQIAWLLSYISDSAKGSKVIY